MISSRWLGHLVRLRRAKKAQSQAIILRAGLAVRAMLASVALQLRWRTRQGGEASKTEILTPASNLLRSKMPELGTIRGIAVLLVLFFHGFGFRYGLQGLSWLPRLFMMATLPGWAGVNLFFVLSGFLITGILLDTKLKTNYYQRFYARRALRILPLYYSVLALPRSLGANRMD